MNETNFKYLLLLVTVTKIFLSANFCIVSYRTKISLVPMTVSESQLIFIVYIETIVADI